MSGHRSGLARNGRGKRPRRGRRRARGHQVGRRRSEADLSEAAIHEAGHIVVAYLLGGVLGSATIERRGSIGGTVHAEFLDAEVRAYVLEGSLRGGRRPQESELETAIHRRRTWLEIVYGLAGEQASVISRRLSIPEADGHLPEAQGDYQGARERALALGLRVPSALWRARRQARSMLRRNWRAVEAIAAALRSRKRLSGKCAWQILRRQRVADLWT